MKLRDLFEAAPAQKVVAVMPGGFHPFHPGHKSLYDWAVETFGKENVYVAATNDTTTRPFPFDVKIKLAQMAGVPTNRFIQVKSPFNALSYNDIVGDASQTALVFVRSEKDKTSHPLPDQVRKSDGNMGYLISYTGDDNLETADTHGYLAYGPTIDFDFSGMSIKSASELRAAWPEMSEEDKLKAAELMYPGNGQTAAQLLDQALGSASEPVAAESSIASKINWGGQHDDDEEEKNNKKKKKQSFFNKLKSAIGMEEDASEDEEDDFHRKLDKLVHKTFGHSSDEKKMKKTNEKAPPGREDQVKALKKEFPDDEGAPYAIAWAQHNKKKKKTNESDVVIDPVQLRQYLRMLIDDAIDKEQDIDKLSKVLKILVGKEIKSRGKRYQITSEDVVSAFEASCKSRRKKKMRESEYTGPLNDKQKELLRKGYKLDKDGVPYWEPDGDRVSPFYQDELGSGWDKDSLDRDADEIMPGTSAKFDKARTDPNSSYRANTTTNFSGGGSTTRHRDGRVERQPGINANISTTTSKKPGEKLRTRTKFRGNL